jgi:hypothetical protein
MGRSLSMGTASAVHTLGSDRDDAGRVFLLCAIVRTFMIMTKIVPCVADQRQSTELKSALSC